MKRILPIFLLFVLLVGCGNSNANDITPTTGDYVSADKGPSAYITDSQVEKDSQGAVRQYDLSDIQFDTMTFAGENLLLILHGDETKLTAFSGTTGAVVSTLIIPSELSVWQPTYGGFVYYDTDNNQAVYLDHQLRETQRHKLSDGIMGVPAFSVAGDQVFYCVGQEIWAMDTQMNVTRPVRTNTCQSQTLLGAYLDGAVLAVSLFDENGNGSVMYISTKTGEKLSTDDAVKSINSYNDKYFATRKDGTVTQYICGVDGSESQQLNVLENAAAGACEINGAVGYTAAENSLQLGFYDLSTGTRTGVVNLTGVWKLTQFLADRWGGCVWMVTEEHQLLRWDPKRSAVAEDTVYFGPVYSATAPDEEGLKALQDRVDQMCKTYGVSLRIWEAAVKSNNGYDLEPEYQTEAITKTLDQIEALLQEFPENFLYKSVKRTIRICVVRSVAGKIDSAYYWYDKDPFIILSVGVDIREAFLKDFAYVLDIHVLGNSPLIDEWATLNPEGFTYGMEEYDPSWLEGDTRVFVSADAMKTLVDDRASVFYQAMQKDNEEMFKSDIMQAKLLQLCKAIRDAWRLERKTDIYLWEQYLTESIAYKEA